MCVRSNKNRFKQGIQSFKLTSKPAPAQGVAEFELRRFTSIKPGESAWNMPPSDQTDQAWDDLIDST